VARSRPIRVHLQHHHYGLETPTKHSKAEAAYTTLCRHYNQTCISYHEAVSPQFSAKQPNFTMADVAGDCLHPNRGTKGNDYMTDLLVNFLATASRRVAALPRGGGGSGSGDRHRSGGSVASTGSMMPPTRALPPPLFDVGDSHLGWRTTAISQARTSNERCYGFGTLGGLTRQR
jgi:hypothetical protein